MDQNCGKFVVKNVTDQNARKFVEDVETDQHLEKWFRISRWMTQAEDSERDMEKFVQNMLSDEIIEK